MAKVLTHFSGAARNYSRPNLHLMPSFPTQAYEVDRVHLNAYSGFEFVLHLFDSSQSLLDSLSAPGVVRKSAASESTRLLEDRVMALEQDHHRLNSLMELKTAEAQDLAANDRMLDSIVISGLKPIQGRLGGKEWQERAQEDVRKVLKSITGKDYVLRVVRNSTGMAPNSPVTYAVAFTNTTDPAKVRTEFGTFFALGKDSRPPELSKVSVQNFVTKGTRIRISIMKLLAQRYSNSNPEGKA